MQIIGLCFVNRSSGPIIACAQSLVGFDTCGREEYGLVSETGDLACENIAFHSSSIVIVGPGHRAMVHQLFKVCFCRSAHYVEAVLCRPVTFRQKVFVSINGIT